MKKAIKTCFSLCVLLTEPVWIFTQKFLKRKMFASRNKLTYSCPKSLSLFVLCVFDVFFWLHILPTDDKQDLQIQPVSKVYHYLCATFLFVVTIIDHVQNEIIRLRFGFIQCNKLNEIKHLIFFLSSLNRKLRGFFSSFWASFFLQLAHVLQTN
jgi:hypothetical protein